MKRTKISKIKKAGTFLAWGKRVGHGQRNQARQTNKYMHMWHSKRVAKTFERYFAQHYPECLSAFPGLCPSGMLRPGSEEDKGNQS